jgi:hypothetical protein
MYIVHQASVVDVWVRLRIGFNWAGRYGLGFRIPSQNGFWRQIWQNGFQIRNAEP